MRCVMQTDFITNQIKQVKFNQEGLKHGRAN
jgi:hypothetical protein